VGKIHAHNDGKGKNSVPFRLLDVFSNSKLNRKNFKEKGPYEGFRGRVAKKTPVGRREEEEDPSALASPSKKRVRGVLLPSHQDMGKQRAATFRGGRTEGKFSRSQKERVSDEKKVQGVQ